MNVQQVWQNLVELECSITLAHPFTQDQLEKALADHINDLINHRFSDLVSLLYRVDIDEARLRSLLANQSSQDAAPMIARLILKRIWQKMETRKRFKPSGNPPEEEKW